MCHKCGDPLTPYEACCAPQPPDECPECGGEIEEKDGTWWCVECPWPAGEDTRTERERREDAEIEKWEASRDE
jgi:uncharacterized Zn finger protein (UPF0148 family)